MRQDTKELILKESFKLFAWNRYEQVTVSDLERVTKLTRGAIFYYMKNKEHLFVEVLDKYMLHINSPQVEDGKQTLLSYIDSFVEQIKKTKKQMNTLGVKNMNFAYANIANQAIFYYPEFTKQLREKENEELKNWIKILQLAVRSGEIKDTIDVETVAVIFQQTYSGLGNKGIIHPEGIDVDETHKVFMCIYNIIKK
ncbi:MAG: TetR/AcrR family transcriptional regulator [Tannerella sp.]|jgi:AcrR family transcriptional regulator|nr:TetR/AcrR family transcriptional regulator [Tannerella sp.]